jgi:hypothetical protein
MKIGDLVWCQNGIRRNMGIIVGLDPDYPHPDTGKSFAPEDYVWVILTEGSPGQEKWVKVKKLELISESG